MGNLFLLGLIFVASPVMASCYTGFACSMETLQLQQNINVIENYFAKNCIEPDYITGATNILTYNDLFMFNTIV